MLIPYLSSLLSPPPRSRDPVARSNEIGSSGPPPVSLPTYFCIPESSTSCAADGSLYVRLQPHSCHKHLKKMPPKF